MADFDVLIAGAGPAGCATAISLADFAPKLRVGLIDAQPEASRIGETVPPQIKPILDHLALSPAFAVDKHSASYRTLSAWGGPQLLSNEFLFHTQQVGWRLDRVRFDAMMLRGAAARVSAHVAGKVAKLEFKNGNWSVHRGDGASHTARAVVDATGRAATLARLHGLRPTRLDRLVSCFMFCQNRDAGAAELMIEAVRDGWWYTAVLPDGRRVIAFVSDTDIVRRLGLGQRDRWMRALRETDHLHAVTAGAEPLGSPQFRGAGSQMVVTDSGQTLICVGDAASSFDPVSGQGIVKAMRSGVFASYAIADHLERGDSGGLRRYGVFVKSEFAAYRDALRDYYAQERRWPNSPFWQRRRDGRRPNSSHAIGPPEMRVPVETFPRLS